MSILEYIIVIIYSFAIVVMFLYGLAELGLLINYLSDKRKTESPTKIDLDTLKGGYPKVTIQLPVFNELYVMEALLKNLAKIDYPKEKLEIQVLDDSTDETYNLTQKYVVELKQKGFDIVHLHREKRDGFKAGALKEALPAAKGEFIAIFDADFLPDADWLLQTLPYFSNEQIGVIQTRWGHTNRDHSLLTKIQAFALDLHFTLEQVGRNTKNHFINFNGTAGIWRKECILDAGNWEGDTLTEDLDLSYRAQLKKWKFIYIEDVVTPAELPVAMSAVKSQQFRWNKGGAENFQKLFKKLIRNKNISIKTKLYGIFHLLNSTLFLNLFIIALLSVPILYIKNKHPHLNGYFIGISFFIITTLIYFIAFWVSYRSLHGKGYKNFLSFIRMFFSFFSVAMVFSLHNTIAVLEGHLGKRSDFIRTPKFNLNAKNNNWKDNKYLTNQLSFTVIFEGILTFYFGFGMYSAFIVNGTNGDFGLFPFHLMLFLGFGYVFIKSLTSRV